LNRLCDGNDVPNLEEIEKSYTVPDEFIERYKNHLKSKVELYTGELITQPALRVLSSGPNSKPKWQTADVEAYALMNSELHDHFKELSFATGNADLYEYMKQRASTIDRVERKRLRYITTVRDKGNKCRLVAISDYWTQVLLEPIMIDLQKYAKQKFPHVSFSHNHERGFINLKKFIRPGVKSYDVSSWTDAFPSVLQLEFMRSRYGPNIAQAWYSLVVSCEWNIKGSKSTVKYNRGQGMGTNGSFDIATITDLHLLEMIYNEEYKMAITEDTFNKVGDDLWCYDPDEIVLDTYINKCGIDINPSKSKFATKENLCGEFVSRSINYGHDVSRISANICRAVKRNILDLPQLAHHLQERDYESIIPIEGIFDDLRIKENHRRRVVRALYCLCKLYPKQGLELLEKSLNESVPNLVHEDQVISIIKAFGIDSLRDTYYSYSVMLLLNSIIDKTEKVFDATIEFDSSAHLAEKAEPDKWWVTEDGIPLLTSKLLMAKSFRAHNEIYSSPQFKDCEHIMLTLEKCDQAMTFKELGVISTSGERWRPKVTRLYNLVNSLVVRDHESLYLGPIGQDEHPNASHYLTTTMDVGSKEPIFTGVSRKVIGQLK
jgi:hypothetical protein